MISDEYSRLPCSAITIKRDERQRTEVNTRGIKDSIARDGVWHPIIVTRDLVLVAGERRLTASLELGLADIPCRYVDQLSSTELQVIELEENLRRADLCWQDQVRAFGKLHELLSGNSPDWTISATADHLGYHPSHISGSIRVYKELADPKVQAMPTFFAARNFLGRKDERGIDNALSMIVESGLTVALALAQPKPLGIALPQADLSSPDLQIPEAPAAKPLVLPAGDSILLADFRLWAPQYSGPKFNFLHCDFPYGIDLFAGKKSGRERAEHTYEDAEDTYWTLLGTLCAHRDNILQASAHCMFWFSMDYYTDTIAFLGQHAPEFIVNAFPLIWHKSCGSGITPDPQRGPKRAYETALLLSRGDRVVCRSVANFYAAQTDKRLHHSCKPEPMLRHFFQLFVDEHTRMLDPTCGGGSALRAAESLGAQLVLGLEKEEPFYKNACDGLKNFRVLAAASKMAQR